MDCLGVSLGDRLQEDRGHPRTSWRIKGLGRGWYPAIRRRIKLIRMPQLLDAQIQDILATHAQGTVTTTMTSCIMQQVNNLPILLKNGGGSNITAQGKNLKPHPGNISSC